MERISRAASFLERVALRHRRLALRFPTRMDFCSTNTQVVSSLDDNFDDMQRLGTSEGYHGERSRSDWDVGLADALVCAGMLGNEIIFWRVNRPFSAYF